MATVWSSNYDVNLVRLFPHYLSDFLITVVSEIREPDPRTIQLAGLDINGDCRHSAITNAPHQSLYALPFNIMRSTGIHTI